MGTWINAGEGRFPRMFLKKTKRPGGRVYLSICEGWREGGRVRQRTVEPVGYLDELEAEYADPLAHFEARAAELTAEKAARTAPVAITVHPAQRVDKRGAGARREAGSCVPLAVYNALGVEAALNNERAATGSRASYSLAQAMRLMVVERLLSPGSKLSDLRGAGGHFFASDLSEDDLYRSLTELARARDRVAAAVSSHAARLAGRDATRVYYDVTNYYWEVDDEDPDAGAGAGLRRRGVSKEHRPEPIVQMGLLVDRNAVPIDYRLFPGNEHDGATMSEFVAAAAPGAGEVVWVADKGCNTRANMVDCVARGHHFLWSQSIRGTKSTAEMRSWVTSGEGYRGIDGDPDAGPGFRVKSRQDTLELEVEVPGGARSRVPVEVKYVAFWSRKYQQRARRERARTVERAMDLVAHPSKYAAVTDRGAMKYVSARDADPETGEVAGPTQLAFDAEALAADEACDGYYLIVTSKTDMPDLEVIDTYRGLWRIEESFRITKSDLRARPVYLSRADHIEAHFLVCFTALTVVRLMQLAVRERRGDGTAPTAAQMLGDLSRVAATRLESNWWVFDHRTDLTDELFAAFGLEVPTRYMQLRDIRRLGAKRNAWKGLSGR